MNDSAGELTGCQVGDADVLEHVGVAGEGRGGEREEDGADDGKVVKPRHDRPVNAG